MINGIHIVNSFTGEDVKGNPAGVVLTPEQIDITLMQRIATRLGYSETAFIQPLKKYKRISEIKANRNLSIERPSEKSEYCIRWFTPEEEVPLCGHATLAAAAVLFQERSAELKVHFHSQSGDLFVFRDGDRYILDFPSDLPLPYIPSEELLTALRLDSYEACVLGKKTEYILIQLRNEEMVADSSPCFSLLKTIGHSRIKGIMITSISGHPAFSFVSRFFDPWSGIMEDPVTGSAHTLAGPYWQKILKKNTLTAKQISERGGILYLQFKKDQRIYIGGQAEIKGKKEFSDI